MVQVRLSVPVDSKVREKIKRLARKKGLTLTEFMNKLAKDSDQLEDAMYGMNSKVDELKSELIELKKNKSENTIDQKISALKDELIILIDDVDEKISEQASQINDLKSKINNQNNESNHLHNSAIVTQDQLDNADPFANQNNQTF